MLNTDNFGVERGRCRCHRCKQFVLDDQKISAKNVCRDIHRDGEEENVSNGKSFKAFCATCGCPSNRHVRTKLNRYVPGWRQNAGPKDKTEKDYKREEDEAPHVSDVSLKSTIKLNENAQPKQDSVADDSAEPISNNAIQNNENQKEKNPESFNNENSNLPRYELKNGLNDHFSLDDHLVDKILRRNVSSSKPLNALNEKTEQTNSRAGRDKTHTQSAETALSPESAKEAEKAYLLFSSAKRNLTATDIKNLEASTKHCTTAIQLLNKVNIEGRQGENLANLHVFRAVLLLKLNGELESISSIDFETKLVDAPVPKPIINTKPLECRLSYLLRAMKDCSYALTIKKGNYPPASIFFGLCMILMGCLTEAKKSIEKAVSQLSINKEKKAPLKFLKYEDLNTYANAGIVLIKHLHSVLKSASHDLKVNDNTSLSLSNLRRIEGFCNFNLKFKYWYIRTLFCCNKLKEAVQSGEGIYVLLKGIPNELMKHADENCMKYMEESILKICFFHSSSLCKLGHVSAAAAELKQIFNYLPHLQKLSDQSNKRTTYTEKKSKVQENATCQSDWQIKSISLLEKCENIVKIKNEGNSAFREKQYHKAVRAYSLAMKQISKNENFRRFSAIMYCNRAAAWKQLGKLESCISDCKEALNIVPLYNKALLRKARAESESANLRIVEQSVEDFRRLLRQMTISDRVIRKQKGQSSNLAQVNAYFALSSSCTRNDIEAELKRVLAKFNHLKSNNKAEPKANQRPRRTSYATNAGTQSSNSQTGQKPGKSKSDSTYEKPRHRTSEKENKWQKKQNEDWKKWHQKAEWKKSTGFHSRSSNTGGQNKNHEKSRGFTGGSFNDWLNGKGKIKDYYKVLGVSSEYSRQEIKKKFFRLALKFHPDKNQSCGEALRNNYEEKFKLITEAYNVLGDDKQREQYDRYRRCIGTD